MHSNRFKNLTSSLKISIVVGGRWHAFDLARELFLKGHLHRLITNYPAYYVKRWGIPEKHIVSLPITFFLIKFIYWLGGESLMMRCQWLVHSLFARQAAKYLSGSKLIHAWSSWAEPSLIWAANRSIPTLLERSSAHILEQSRLLTEEYQRLNLKWIPTHKKIEEMECDEYKIATKISTPSQFVLNSFLDRGFDHSQLVRNGLGVNQDLFTPSQEDKSMHSVSLSILYAGTISVQKGIHDLLIAFENFSHSKATLTLLGGMTAPIKRLLNRTDYRINLPGHKPQADLPAFYQAHNLFVMPSIQDGMAMVQLQALASGLPLVCTTNSGGEDLLQMGGNSPVIHKISGEQVLEYPAGWVIPIHCPHVLTEIFLKLSQNLSILAAKRNNAIALTKTEFTWQSYAERAISIYMSLLEKNE